MDEIKVYKPGQLITINNKVYRIKALVEEESQKNEVINDRIEFIKRIKNLIKRNNILGLDWDDGRVYCYNKDDDYAKADNIERDFEFLNELFDLYLLKHSKESITFTEEEIEKIKKLKEIANNDNIWDFLWDSGGVDYYDKRNYGYLRAFDDNNFSLLKKIINLCLKRGTKLDN
jgi:hypothetical protein